jgi:ribulose bisphosphate carboxylase small subunit
MEANTALSTARMEAHPGDPRRMMGTNTPYQRASAKGSINKTNLSTPNDRASQLQAMLHAHLEENGEYDDDDDDPFQDYWTSCQQDFR